MKTCAKCAAAYNGRPAPKQHDYWCGSTTWNDGDFYQSPECVRRERDQLLEQNRELVESLQGMLNLLDCIYNAREDFTLALVSDARAALAKAKEAKP